MFCIIKAKISRKKYINKDSQMKFKSKGGHSPFPVKEEGKCCTDCNFKVVIPARMKEILTSKEKEENE